MPACFGRRLLWGRCWIFRPGRGWQFNLEDMVLEIEVLAGWVILAATVWRRLRVVFVGDLPLGLMLRSAVGRCRPVCGWAASRTGRSGWSPVGTRRTTSLSAGVLRWTIGRAMVLSVGCLCRTGLIGRRVMPGDFQPPVSVLAELGGWLAGHLGFCCKG